MNHPQQGRKEFYFMILLPDNDTWVFIKNIFALVFGLSKTV